MESKRRAMETVELEKRLRALEAESAGDRARHEAAA